MKFSVIVSLLFAFGIGVAAEKPDLIIINIDDLGYADIGPSVRPLGTVDDPKPLIDHDGTIRQGFKVK